MESDALRVEAQAFEIDHVGVGAGCISGDDGVAGATGLPSAGGTGGGPMVTSG